MIGAQGQGHVFSGPDGGNDTDVIDAVAKFLGVSVDVAFAPSESDKKLCADKGKYQDQQFQDLVNKFNSKNPIIKVTNPQGIKGVLVEAGTTKPLSLTKLINSTGDVFASSTDPKKKVAWVYQGTGPLRPESATINTLVKQVYASYDEKATKACNDIAKATQYAKLLKTGGTAAESVMKAGLKNYEDVVAASEEAKAKEGATIRTDKTQTALLIGGGLLAAFVVWQMMKKKTPTTE